MVHIQVNMFVCAKSSIKKSTCHLRKIIPMVKLVNQYKNVYKRSRPKIGCFDGFCHHRLATMSTHMYPYHYPLLKVEPKWVCKQSHYVGNIEYYYINTKKNSKTKFFSQQ